jgi:uncharacterized membrane protein
MKITKKLIALIALTSVLSSCGDNPQDRALSGGGIGAGVGAVGSVLVGANPVTGAVLGGAVGAATGGLTKQKDINMGTPAWKK